MPHFSPTGHDTYLCQKCGQEVDSGKDRGQWRPDVTGSKSAGMVCTPCAEKADATPPEVHVLHYVKHDGEPSAVVVWEKGRLTLRQDFPPGDGGDVEAEELARGHARRLGVEALHLKA